MATAFAIGTELVSESGTILDSVVSVQQNGSSTLSYGVDRAVSVDSTGGNYTKTLPDPSVQPGGIFELKRDNAAGNLVRLAAGVGHNIEGLAHFDLINQFNSITVRSNGSNTWEIIKVNVPGADLQMQYNDNGIVKGITGVHSDGSHIHLLDDVPLIIGTDQDTFLKHLSSTDTTELQVSNFALNADENIVIQSTSETGHVHVHLEAPTAATEFIVFADAGELFKIFGDGQITFSKGDLITPNGVNGVNLNIDVGDGTLGKGGDFIVAAGDAGGAGSFAGGAMLLDAGNSIQGGTGGNARLTAGDGATAGDGGSLTLSSGNGGNVGAGDGGVVNIFSGNATAANQDAGIINITGGNTSGFNGVGGIIKLIGGNALHTGSNSVGGAIDLIAGAGAGTGAGGSISLNAGFPIGTGPGGSINITAAGPIAGNLSGSNVSLTAGDGFGTGDGGDVVLQGGAGAAVDGHIALNPNGGHVGVGTDGANAKFEVFDDSADIVNNGILVTQAGAGDAIIEMLAGSTSYTIGIDNSADQFVISAGTGVGFQRLVMNAVSTGIGTVDPDASLLLHLSSSTQGFRPPAMFTTQQDAIATPIDGLQLYNASVKKPKYYNGTNFLSMDGMNATVIPIDSQADWDALSTTSVITISTDTSLLVRSPITTNKRINIVGNIDFSLLADKFASVGGIKYTGAGDFITANGVAFLRIHGINRLDGDGTGTLLNIQNGTIFVEISSCGVFNWADLGTMTDCAQFRVPTAGFFFSGAGFKLNGVGRTFLKEMAGANIVSIAGPFFTLNNTVNTPVIAATVSENTITLKSDESLVSIDPDMGDDSRIIVNGVILLGDGALFDSTGVNGAITVIADAAISATFVTSVTDSSGIARFNFTGPTVYVGQEVENSTFTETTYNGTHIIVATDGTTYYETVVAHVSADTGSFLSNSITVTSTSHGQSNGQSMLITDTQEYNGGASIYNALTNTFQINRSFVVTETGNWDTASLDHEDPRVNSTANPGFVNSSTTVEASFDDSGAPTTITVPAAGALAIVENTNAWAANFIDRLLLEPSTGVLKYVGLEDVILKLDALSIIDPVSGGGTDQLTNQFYKESPTLNVVTFTNGTNLINETATPRVDGDLITFRRTAGALPTGLFDNIIYHVVSQAANSFQVSYTAGGSAITFTTDGTGTNSYSVCAAIGSRPQQAIVAGDPRSLEPHALAMFSNSDSILNVVSNMSDTTNIDIHEGYVRIFNGG